MHHHFPVKIRPNHVVPSFPNRDSHKPPLQDPIALCQTQPHYREWCEFEDLKCCTHAPIHFLRWSQPWPKRCRWAWARRWHQTPMWVCGWTVGVFFISVRKRFDEALVWLNFFVNCVDDLLSKSSVNGGRYFGKKLSNQNMTPLKYTT